MKKTAGRLHAVRTGIENLGRCRASSMTNVPHRLRFHDGASIFARMVRITLLMALLGWGWGCGGGGGSTANQTTPSASYADQFDYLWQTFDQNYSYFVYKNINWQALGNTYRPQAVQATSQSQFAQVLVQMLSNLHDLHVDLIDPTGTAIPTYTDTAFVNFNPSVWQQYLQTKGTNIQQNGLFTTGELGGVAYISVQSWAPSSGTESADLDAALEQFQNAPAIIIDVRMNGGGDSTTAGNFAGRFADQARTGGFYQFRDGPAHTDFGPLQTLQLVPRGPWQFTGPVLLLIGRGCFSSNELFISQMRELPNVTVVGDTSGGHSGHPANFNLSDGWQFTVSTWIFYTAEMQIVEDRGIDPAIFVPTTAADFQSGRDPVLDYAMSHSANMNLSSRFR